MRRAARIDANHAEIVRALRAAGCGVQDTSAVGCGFPDLVVHGPVHPFRTVLLEIKDGKKSASETRLTAAQMRFHAQWRGAVAVVRDVGQALAAVGIQGVDDDRSN